MSKDKIIIGITGEARCGKDSLARELRDKLEWDNIIAITRFAAPLKGAVAGLLNIPVEKLEDDSFKDTIIESLGFSPRKLMELMGTEFGREMLGSDIWIKFMKRTIEELDIYNVVIIPDVRFNDEAEFIKSYPNSTIIKLIRPDNPLRISSDHVSTKGINPLLVDHTYTANTLEELNQVADNIIGRIKK